VREVFYGFVLAAGVSRNDSRRVVRARFIVNLAVYSSGSDGYREGAIEDVQETLDRRFAARQNPCKPCNHMKSWKPVKSGGLGTMRNMSRIAKTKDVATALGVTESTVQLYSRQNRIPFDCTPGGHRRYNLEEVRTALALEEPSLMLAPMTSPGLGAGISVPRSELASMDAERRALVGERFDQIDVPEESSAILDLIGQSSRVLVAL